MGIKKKAAVIARNQQTHIAQAAPPAMGEDHDVLSGVDLPGIGREDQFVEVVKALSMYVMV